MHSIIKRLHFCYGHRLLDYEGKCAHPHGHNGIVELELSRDLDSTGMVYDFTQAKQKFGRALDELDHRMILRWDDPLVEALESIGETPFVMETNPTAENIAKLLFDRAEDLGLPVVSVRLWETQDACAEYRP